MTRSSARLVTLVPKLAAAALLCSILPAHAQTQPVTIRVGLGAADERVLVLSSREGLSITDLGSADPVWLERFAGETRVVLLGGGKAHTVHRIQVGSFRSEASARERARTLEGQVGVPARVHHDPDRGVYRVRVGEFGSRVEASGLMTRMNELGFADAWIASEVLGDATGARLRLVDRDFREQIIGSTRLRVRPAGRGLVSVQGKRYRGEVEIFIDSAGRLRAVNVLDMETYLRGVVPDEMGPTVYPEIEALKAQTVAARTYAMSHLGQFADEGFDLCDTPRCQVYGGADSEHRLTDRAVAETRGEVLLHGGELVNAMFTSTCGGHTEDVQNVFPEQDEPYLRGVRCAPEERSTAAIVARVRGADRMAGWSSAGGPVRAAARLIVAGVLGPEILDGSPERPLETAMWRAGLTRFAVLLGKTAPAPAGDGKSPSRGALAMDLVVLLGWQERVTRLMRPHDAAVLLGLEPERKLPQSAVDAGARELALLIRDGVLDPESAASDQPWERPVLLSEAVRALADLLERYGVELLDEVRARSLEARRLLTSKGNFEVSAEPFLFGAVGASGSGAVAPMTTLPITRDEPVLIHRDGKGRVDYIEAQRPFRTLTDDRFSRLVTWEVRRTREEVSRRLARSLSVGQVVDLKPLSRGVSGRVVDLEVVGTGGRARLKGFRIRRALDLNETLFTIDRQRDGDGNVVAFVFAGMGWGHGLGMCQVGAYGMAVRGKSYVDILRHYYTGVSVTRMDGRAGLPDTP